MYIIPNIQFFYCWQIYILPYSSLTNALFLPIAGALIWCMTTPFTYTNMFVRISGIYGCSSKSYICFENNRKLDGGEEATFFFFFFSTQLKLIYICPNIGGKLAHKMVGSFQERKDKASHFMFQKYRTSCKVKIFEFSKFKFQNWLKPKSDCLGNFLRKTVPLQQKSKKKFLWIKLKILNRV